MTIFIPGNTAVENTRNLAQSALPDAPVVADEPRRPRRSADVRARVGALLRTTARRLVHTVRVGKVASTPSRYDEQTKPRAELG